MTLSTPFLYTAAGSGSTATVTTVAGGLCAAVAQTESASQAACTLVADFVQGRSTSVRDQAPEAAAAMQSGRDLYMYGSHGTQGFIIYEDGLIDRPLEAAGRTLIRRQPSAMPDTVLPAVMLLVLDQKPLDDDKVRDLMYHLADGTLSAETGITCAGLLDPALLQKLTDSLKWHETLQTSEPDAAQEVALLEQKVRQNIFEKQSLDTEKQILHNQLSEIDRLEEEMKTKREEISRRIEHLSTRYSQLVTQEKEVESRLRERTLTLIREQVAFHHGLHRK